MTTKGMRNIIQHKEEAEDNEKDGKDEDDENEDGEDGVEDEDESASRVSEVSSPLPEEAMDWDQFECKHKSINEEANEVYDELKAEQRKRKRKREDAEKVSADGEKRTMAKKLELVMEFLSEQKMICWTLSQQLTSEKALNKKLRQSLETNERMNLLTGKLSDNEMIIQLKEKLQEKQKLESSLRDCQIQETNRTKTEFKKQIKLLNRKVDEIKASTEKVADRLKERLLKAQQDKERMEKQIREKDEKIRLLLEKTGLLAEIKERKEWLKKEKNMNHKKFVESISSEDMAIHRNVTHAETEGKALVGLFGAKSAHAYREVSPSFEDSQEDTLGQKSEESDAGCSSEVSSDPESSSDSSVEIIELTSGSEGDPNEIIQPQKELKLKIKFGANATKSRELFPKGVKCKVKKKAHHMSTWITQKRKKHNKLS